MRRIPRAALVAAAAALTAAAAALPAAPSESSPPRSGLHGSVRLSPALPVCEVDSPCSRPLPNFTLVFSRRGAVVARARTNDAGRYRVALAAGAYAVRSARPQRLGRGLTPTRVRVPDGRFRRIDFSYDAGIR